MSQPSSPIDKTEILGLRALQALRATANEGKLPHESETLDLIVGGVPHTMRRDDVLEFPSALLAELLSANVWTDQQPLFLDRHPRAFEGVARFYRTRGRALERPWKVARTTWGCELRFFRLWGLGDKAEQAEAAALAAKTAGRPVKPGLRQGLWDLLEDPSSSTASKVTTFVSVAVIVASVFSMSSETVFPVTSAEAQEYHAAQKEWQRTRTQWEVAQTAWNHSGDASGSFAGWSGGPMPEDVPETQGWERTEAACIAYFTLEFVLRFYVTTEKYKFMKGPLNLVDLVAILPFYIGLLLPGGVEGVSVVRVVRLVRVFRVFKIGAHVRGLEVFRRTFLTSIHELALLLFFVMLAVLLFGCLIYFVERQPDRFHALKGISDEHDDTLLSSFEYRDPNVTWSLPGNVVIIESVPHGFWWTLCTMTSLGYGEVYPSTYVGFVVGGIASLAGLITLALPMVIIGQKFSENFRQVEQEAEEAADAETAALARAEAKARAKIRRTDVFQRIKQRQRTRSLSLPAASVGSAAERPAPLALPASIGEEDLLKPQLLSRASTVDAGAGATHLNQDGAPNPLLTPSEVRLGGAAEP